jgi:hypothetical protein
MGRRHRLHGGKSRRGTVCDPARPVDERVRDLLGRMQSRLEEWLAGFNRPFGEFTP